MAKTKALCIDRQFCSNPEYIGLDNENLLAQDWLEVLESGTSARDALRHKPDINEIWIMGCDDIEPINLAAALKKDRPELMVRLIVGQINGSLCSRAATACVDEVVELMRFAQLYAITKQHETQAARHQQKELGTPMHPTPAPQCACSTSNKTPAAHASDTHITEAFLPMSKTEHISACPPAIAQQPRTHKGFLMSVVSGSGGTGKSSVATLAALYASEQGYHTLLIDLDLQFGDIASMIGSIDAIGIDALITNPERRAWAGMPQSGLAVITAPARLEMSEKLIDKLPRVLDEAMGHFDVVIANTGANWAEQHALLLERSSVALFLLDQRSSSIRACHHALELCARCGIASVPFKFALNRCSKTAPFNAADVSSVMQGAPIFELKDGGAEVEECLASGHFQDLSMQGNEFAASIGRMMNRLLPATEASFSQQGMPHETPREANRWKARFTRKHAKAVA